MASNQITVKTTRGPRVLTPGLLDEEAQRAFSEGQCHALAIAIAELTSLPLVALMYYDYNKEDEFGPLEEILEKSPTGTLPMDIFADSWYHAAVKLGRDRLLDVFGLRSQEEMINTYLDDADVARNADEPTYYHIVPTSAKQLATVHAAGPPGVYGVRPNLHAARVFAPTALSLALEPA